MDDWDVISAVFIFSVTASSTLFWSMVNDKLSATCL
jgi:hypothetical protein